MTADLLAFVDQGAAAGTRATGRNSLIQVTWIYDDGVDLAGLERFRTALTGGLLGRRIAHSPLPFGRDRWVATTAAPRVAVEAVPRPREAIDGWLDERAAASGGTESTLLFRATARIAAGLGWVRPDGQAVLGLSVNRREDGDLRGNAIVDAELLVDPAAGPEGVVALRADVKGVLGALPDAGQYDAFGPLLTLLPRRTLASLIDAPPDPAHPVTTCAGVGALPAPVRAPDGTPADRTWFRLAWSALPGRVAPPRPPYLYVGWTGTETETSLFVASNLAAAADLHGVVERSIPDYAHH